jgi:hypothetical protein
MNNIKILLAPSYELARPFNNMIEATVEAEYGDKCINGKLYTLAHHGSRSANPAPCNTSAVNPIKNGTIIISHIDLDTIGGCLALMGLKPNNKPFWQAVEYIDVNGAHHIQDLSQENQDKLNAIYAWNASQNKKERALGIINVTEDILLYKSILDIVLNKDHPQNIQLIKQGKEWAKNRTKEVEDRLLFENEHIRVFQTDDVFCSASYYSPKYNQVKDCTITLNTHFNAVTLAFEDGGKKFNAQEIVQQLWGNEAGGRAGIAGSPRNWDLDQNEINKEFNKLIKVMQDKYKKI